jgi:flavin-dependent dehydrogenase
MKIGIIGAGAVGLYTGLNLLSQGYEVYIFEEHESIGLPMHCTGIVSEDTVEEHISRYIDVEDVFLYKTNRLTLNIADKYILSKESRHKVYIIDRAELDRKLAEIFIDSGGVINLNSKSRWLDNAIMSEKGEKYLFDIIIVAKGAIGAIERRGMVDILPGYQVDLYSEKEEWRDTINFYINKKLNSDFFLWTVPIDGGKPIYRVGTATHNNPRRALEHFIGDSLSRNIMNKYHGHIVLTGPITPFTEGNVVYIGDSAGQTKVTTGGGLRYGFSAGDILSQVISENEDLEKYEEIWLDKWGREIKLQEIARKIYLKLSENEIINILSDLDNVGIIDKFLMKGEVDMHARSLLRLLIGAPKSVRHLTKIIFKLIG